ncbi:MAG: nickel pincer cofactor biosynthesis protein LarB [Planctomycetes bacterium]|nr:nickel pincer cofactor biosynthesis protein LarB [Planctomycetota bacterium]
MNPKRLRSLLDAVKNGEASIDEALAQLAHWPMQDLGHTRLDLQRELRCGFPEVVYGAGKSSGQIIEIAERLMASGGSALVTRVGSACAREVRARVPGLAYDARAEALHTPAPAGSGRVVVVSAGTSDGRVAGEAALTTRMLGVAAEELCDVGVAGLHRLLGHVQSLREADALIVVAGMEGALPSVVGGLVDRPVIAVPTSVGYGASFGGIAALLAMLNSCAPGVTVVNIDNGFGAGYAAAQICRSRASAAARTKHSAMDPLTTERASRLPSNDHANTQFS